MSKPYCGVGKPPKGFKRATMKECLERGQVRYWGVKKIDSRLIEASKRPKKDKTYDEMTFKELSHVQTKYIVLRKKYKKELELEKVQSKKDVIKKQNEKATVQLKMINKILDKLQKEEEAEFFRQEDAREAKKAKQAARKTSKKAPKKTSRKTSRK